MARSPYNIQVSVDLVTRGETLVASKISQLQSAANETAGRINAASSMPGDVGRAGLDQARARATQVISRETRVATTARNQFQADIDRNVQDLLLGTRSLDSPSLDPRRRAREAEARRRIQSVFGVSDDSDDPENDLRNRLESVRNILGNEAYIRQAQGFDSRGVRRGRPVSADTARSNLARAIATGNTRVLGAMGFDISSDDFSSALSTVKSSQFGRSMTELDRGVQSASKALDGYEKASLKLATTMESVNREMQRKLDALRRENERQDRENRQNLQRATRNYQQSQSMVASERNAFRDRQRLNMLGDDDNLATLNRVLGMTDSEWKTLDPSERRRLLDRSSGLLNDTRFFSRSRFGGVHGAELHRIADSVEQRMRGAGIDIERDLIAGQLQQAIRRGSVIDNAVNASGANNLSPLDRVRALFGMAPTQHAPGHVNPYNRDYNTSFNRFNERLSNLSQMAGLSLYGLGSIGFLTAMGGVTSRLYSEQQNQQLMIGGTLNTYLDFGGANRGQSFQMARRRGNQLYEELRQRAEVSVLNTAELSDYFISGGPQLMRAGLGESDVLQIVDQIAAIGKSMGYQSPAIQSDIRDLASGGITVRSQVLRAIGMSRAGLARAQSGGPEALKAYFDETLSGFAPALAEIQNTPMGRMNQVLDRLQRTGIEVGGGFFSGIDKPLADVAASLQKLNENEGLLETAGARFGGFVGAIIEAAAKIMASPIGGVMANPLAAVTTGLGGFMALSQWRERTGFRTQNWMQMTSQERANRPLNYYSMFTEGSWADRMLAGPLPVPGSPDFDEQSARRNQRVGRASRVMAGATRAAGAAAAGFIGLEIADFFLARAQRPDNQNSTAMQEALIVDQTASGASPAAANEAAIREYLSTGQVTGDRSLYNQRVAAARAQLYRNTADTQAHELLYGASPLGLLGIDIPFLGLRSFNRGIPGRMGFDSQMRSRLQQIAERVQRGSDLSTAANAIDMSAEDRASFITLIEAAGGRDRLMRLRRPEQIDQFYRDEIQRPSQGAFDRTRLTPEQAESLMARIRSSSGTGADNRAIREMVSQLVRNESGQLRQSLSNDLESIQTASGIQTGLSSALISQENRRIASLGPANPNAIQNLNRIRGLQVYQAGLNFAANAMDNPESASIQRQAEIDQANETYLQSIRALRMEIVERQRNTEAMRRSTDAMIISSRANVNEQRLSINQNALIRTGRTDEVFRQFFSIQRDRATVTNQNQVSSQIAANQELENAAIMTATLEETNKFFAQVLQDGLPPLKLDEMSYAGIKTEMGGLGTIVARVEQAIRVDFGDHVRSFSDVIDRFEKTVNDFEAKVNAKIQELTGTATGSTGVRDTVTRPDRGLLGSPSSSPSTGTVPPTVLPAPPNYGAPSGNINKVALSGQMVGGVPIEYLNASTDGGGTVYLFGSGEVPLPSGSQSQARQSASSNPSNKARSTASSFVSPLRGVPLHVTSPFGPRRRPAQGASRNHGGVDLRAPMRSDVVATADGRVTFAGTQRGYGNVVYLEHEGGVQTRYAHLDSFKVRVGDRVSRGDLIALSGNTGVSTGPHLHYEVRQNRGGSWVALNPKSQEAMNLIAGINGGGTSRTTNRSSGATSLLSMVGQNAPRLLASQQSEIAQAVSAAADKYNLDESLIMAVIKAESDFNPNAVSSAGAQGLMQLMPSTARSLGVSNSFDIRANIMGGSRYLREQINTFGDLEKALAAYNAGPGNVRRYGGIPPFRETQAYVKRVLGSQKSFELVSQGRIGQSVQESYFESSRLAEEQAKAERNARAIEFLNMALNTSRGRLSAIGAVNDVENTYRVNMVGTRTSRDRLQAIGTRNIGRLRNQVETELASLQLGLDADLNDLSRRWSDAANDDERTQLERQTGDRVERFVQDSSRVQQKLDDLNLTVARALRNAERLDEQFSRSVTSAISMADSVSMLGVAAYRTRGLADASIMMAGEQMGVTISNLQERRNTLVNRLSEMGAPVQASTTLGGMMAYAVDSARRGSITQEIARVNSQLYDAMRGAEDIRAAQGLASATRNRQQIVDQINVQSSVERMNRDYSRGFDMFMSPVSRVDVVRQSMADRDARAETQAVLYRQRIEAEFVQSLQSQGMSSVEIQNRLSEAVPQLDMQAANYRQRALGFRNMLLPVDIARMESAATADRMAGIGSAAASALASDPLGLFTGRSGSFLSTSLAGPLSSRMDSIGRRGSVLSRIISRQSITQEDLASIGYSQMANGAFRDSRGRIVQNLRGVLTSQLAAEIGGPMLGTWAGTAIGGSEESSSLGSQIGALAGPSLFAGLGAWGGPVGAVAGGLLGGLFGRRRNPQDEENRRWQQDVVRLLASMDKSLRSENDLARMYRGSAYVGADTRYFSGRYNAPTSRDMTLGDVRR